MSEVWRAASAGAAFGCAPARAAAALLFLASPDVFAFWGLAGIVYGLMLARQRSLDGVQHAFLAIFVLFGLSWIYIIKHWENKIDKGFKEAEAEMAREQAERKKELAKAAGEVQAAAAGGAIQVTAAQFARAYEDSYDQADRQYKNKVLEITGTVQEVDFNRGQGDTYTILLKGGPDETVDCEFAKNPDVRARLAQLKPGDTVTIRGKCLGGGPTIEACVLVQPAAAPGD